MTLTGKGGRGSPVVGRRGFLSGMVVAAGALGAGRAQGFAGASAFQIRGLLTGTAQWGGPRASAPASWAEELMRRTSAPARASVTAVHASHAALWDQPVVLWAGAGAVQPLTGQEQAGIAQFLRLGGILIVDDSEPDRGDFGRTVRDELSKVLPESAPIELDRSHVIFKSFYILDRPVGRVMGPPSIQAMVRDGVAQVILLRHDLCGALARTDSGTWALPVASGAYRQRELAIRLAVNLAMYVLCSDYKDDQVHAPWLMRRRSRRAP